jgi:hypothetical protein
MFQQWPAAIGVGRAQWRQPQTTPAWLQAGLTAYGVWCCSWRAGCQLCLCNPMPSVAVRQALRDHVNKAATTAGFAKHMGGCSVCCIISSQPVAGWSARPATCCGANACLSLVALFQPAACGDLAQPCGAWCSSSCSSSSSSIFVCLAWAECHRVNIKDSC